jgi:hypothetical protein
MRVIVLRKQDVSGGLPEEVQQKVEEATRTALIEEIRRRLGEIEAGLEDMSAEELAGLLQRLRGERKLLRKGEVTIIPESVLQALDNLVKAVGELASKFPALDEKEREGLLEIVEKIEANLDKIKEQLREGTVVIGEELRKQLEGGREDYSPEDTIEEDEKKEYYSPEDIIEEEEKKIKLIEVLISLLRAETASLRRELIDIEKNTRLLAVPGERDVFIEQGWFERKVTSIKAHVSQIEELGSELAAKLAELGGKSEDSGKGK